MEPTMHLTDEQKAQEARRKADLLTQESQKQNQQEFDKHRAKSIEDTLALLWQAYDAAWHLPLHQSGHIQEALSLLLFEQALLARKQPQT